MRLEGGGGGRSGQIRAECVQVARRAIAYAKAPMMAIADPAAPSGVIGVRKTTMETTMMTTRRIVLPMACVTGCTLARACIATCTAQTVQSSGADGAEFRRRRCRVQAQTVQHMGAASMVHAGAWGERAGAEGKP